MYIDTVIFANTSLFKIVHLYISGMEGRKKEKARRGEGKKCFISKLKL